MNRRAMDLVLIGGAAGTGFVLFALLRHVVVSGIDTLAVTYLVASWIPYTLTWYAIGRRFGSPGETPSMRPVDFGSALVVLALLVSIGFDTWGFTPSTVPAGHVIQAVAIYVGLALFGWGIGRRSAALDRLTADRDEPTD